MKDFLHGEEHLPQVDSRGRCPEISNWGETGAGVANNAFKSRTCGSVGTNNVACPEVVSDVPDDTTSIGGGCSARGRVRPLQVQYSGGEILDSRYRVIGLIGSGGSGDVYEVERVDLAQRCALKILRNTGADPGAEARFLREARMMARLASEHVIRIADFGYLGPRIPFLVMERPSGEDLASLLRRLRRLPIGRAVQIAIDACWGLHSVHEAGLVHRDIKPSNLFVARRDAGGDRCKILDFGVSRSSTNTGNAAGQLVGTLRYMAPEQVSEGQVDHRADIYALAAVLFECLTGFTPHREDRVARLLFSIMNQDSPLLTDLLPDIPSGLCECVKRGLARDPKLRFQSAAEFAQALHELALGKSASEGDATNGSVPRSRGPIQSRLRWYWYGAVTAAWVSGIGVLVHSARNSLGRPAQPAPASAVPTTSHPVTEIAALSSERITSVTLPTSSLASASYSPRRSPVIHKRNRDPNPTASAFVRLGLDIAPAQIDARNPYGN